MKTGNVLVIYYPSGAIQRCRPSSAFNGDWASLAQSIAASYFPEIGGKRTVNFKVE